jgi:hypothetical protein
LRKLNIGAILLSDNKNDTIMKYGIIIFVTLFISNSLFAQFSVHLNYSEPTKIGMGIGYDFSKRFWSDVTFSRGIADAEWDGESVLDHFRIDNISADLSMNYNIISKKRNDIYIGIGGLFNFSNETYAFFTLPIGVRFRPFEGELDKIMFQIEIQPAINSTDIYSFGRLGVHYSF